jgi:hypothetical protein
MCTYRMQNLTLTGSGKGAAAWFPLTRASVYFDHPQHASSEHTLNIDFLDPERGPSSRIAVELSAGSARALAEAILASLPPATL